MTLRQFPDVGLLRVRILEDRATHTRFLDVREYLPPKGFSSNGIRISARSQVELLHAVFASVLRDPLL